MKWLIPSVIAGVTLLGSVLIAQPMRAAGQLTAKLTGPTQTSVGKAVNFDASGSTGDIVRYTWNFGDGTFAMGAATMTHTYSTPGTYAVTIDVVDAESEDAFATLTVTVADMSDMPSVSLAEEADINPAAMPTFVEAGAQFGGFSMPISP